MPGSQPHILVVDDEAAIREGLAVALQGTYVVHTAATGRQALALLRQYPIVAIVLDAILKAEHGLDLVPDFRRVSPASVLVLTGHSTEELAIRALRTGVRDYQKKPVDLHELRNKVARLVRQASSPLDPVARASRLLEDRPESPHTTASLAQEVGLSERHFRRRFREVFGKTPRRYLTEVRMNLAAERLLCTDKGIEEIGYALGYSSPTTFGRLFKCAFGLTPSEYRKRFR